MNNILPITKWGLSNKDTEIIKEQLGAWLQHFINLAEDRTGNVYRADFENFDLFYFTECNDLVSHEIESTGVEATLDILRRKRMILFQIFIRYLLGEDLNRKLKCSHCGLPEGVYIGGLPSGAGHYRYCPKCGKTDICTYPAYYQQAIIETEKELQKKGFDTDKFKFDFQKADKQKQNDVCKCTDTTQCTNCKYKTFGRMKKNVD